MDSAKLRDLRSLVEAFRGVVVDWDAIVASVEALKREDEQLRAGSERLDREHRELRNAHDRLRQEREEADRAVAELRSDREALLREHQASAAALRELDARYEALRGEHEAATQAQHELDARYEALRREHEAATQAQHELREEYDVLTQARSSNGHAGNSSGLTEELARQQAAVRGIVRVSAVVFQDVTQAALAEMVLAAAIESLQSDAALMLLCDRDGNFTETQKGDPALVSQLHGLLNYSFKHLVKAGGKETLRLTGDGHAFSAVAALIPNTGNSIGVLCLGRGAAKGTYLADENQFVMAYARSICLGLQNIFIRDNRENNLFDTMSFFVTALESRDPYLQGHSARVSMYAGEIAATMGLSPAQVAVIRRTGVLHDLGKLMLPDSIRLKPKSLAKEEYALVMRHPLVTDKMLKPLRFLASEARAVRHHLERYDGAGYPDGLKGEEIPLPARVVAVADCFDAMISERPYRGALSMEMAVEKILQGAQTQFDPAVTAAFGSIPQARLAEIARYYDRPSPPLPESEPGPDASAGQLAESRITSEA